MRCGEGRLRSSGAAGLQVVGHEEGEVGCFGAGWVVVRRATEVGGAARRGDRKKASRDWEGDRGRRWGGVEVAGSRVN